MSSAPDRDRPCIFETDAARSERPADDCSRPRISQYMLVGAQTAVIRVPFFVHFIIPISESIDFSHEGSFSTTHLGILAESCISISSVPS